MGDREALRRTEEEEAMTGGGIAGLQGPIYWVRVPGGARGSALLMAVLYGSERRMLAGSVVVGDCECEGKGKGAWVMGRGSAWGKWMASAAENLESLGTAARARRRSQPWQPAATASLGSKLHAKQQPTKLPSPPPACTQIPHDLRPFSSSSTTLGAPTHTMAADIATLSTLLEASLDPRQNKQGV